MQCASATRWKVSTPVEEAGIAQLNGVETPLPAAPVNPPSMIGAMMATLNIVTDRVARSRMVSNPPDIHVNARVGHIALTDFHRADELIELGRDAVRVARHDLKEALDGLHADMHSLPVLSACASVNGPAAACRTPDVYATVVRYW